MGYTIFVLATMLVLPLVSIVVELRRNRQGLLELIGKWFIFWGVGVRLLVAGLVQIINPGFTSDLLQLDGEELLIVQELGFTNVLLALVALVSLWKPGYRILGTAGAIYMGFAGWLHLANRNSASTFNETVALWSDFWICLVVLVYLAYRLLSVRSSASPLSQDALRRQ